MKFRPSPMAYGITLIAIVSACAFLFIKNSGISRENRALHGHQQFLENQLSTERGMLLGTIRDLGQKQAYLSTYAYIPASMPDGFPPNLIFTGKTANWGSLAQYLPDFADKSSISPKIITSFSSAFPSAPHPLPTLRPDGEIHFPEYGEYYLRTSAGNFKILALDPGAGNDGNILSIVTFVARNIIHGNANIPATASPEGYNALTGKLFLSDAPLYLWCTQSTRILNHILSRMGYSVRHIQLNRADGLGHHVSEAYFPEAKKWGMIDTDYGVFAVDTKTGTILDISEIATRMKTAPESIDIRFLVQKYSLLPHFNIAPFTPIFSWSPEHLDKNAPVTPEIYMGILAEYGQAWKIVESSRQP